MNKVSMRASELLETYELDSKGRILCPDCNRPIHYVDIEDEEIDVSCVFCYYEDHLDNEVLH